MLRGVARHFSAAQKESSAGGGLVGRGAIVSSGGRGNCEDSFCNARINFFRVSGLSIGALGLGFGAGFGIERKFICRVSTVGIPQQLRFKTSSPWKIVLHSRQCLNDGGGIGGGVGTDCGVGLGYA